MYEAEDKLEQENVVVSLFRWQCWNSIARRKIKR